MFQGITRALTSFDLKPKYPCRVRSSKPSKQNKPMKVAFGTPNGYIFRQANASYAMHSEGGLWIHGVLFCKLPPQLSQA